QISPERYQALLDLIDNGPRLQDLVDPAFLQILADASGRFSFQPDRQLAIKALKTGSIETGYTVMKTRVVYYNPFWLTGVPELNMKQWGRAEASGFTFHEAGHHAPEVLQLDDKLVHSLKDIEIIPESYRGNPQSENDFLHALQGNLINALLDIWLESFLSRRPYYTVEHAIESTHANMGDVEDYTVWNKPQQYIQALLRSRMYEDKDIATKMDPD